MLAAKLMSAMAGSAQDKLYVDDCFSTYLYTGNGSTQTINNGIDLAGKGGLVWIKSRNYSGDRHILVDTVRGAGDTLASNLTDATTPYANTVSGITSTGFSLGSNPFVNRININFASWTFRKAPKFFDVVTYTGNGAAGRQIPHALGIAPGMIIVKCTSLSSTNWCIYHKASPLNFMFNQNAGADSLKHYFGNSTVAISPTAEVFTISGSAVGNDINISGGTYVAYLFAHDPSADGIIQCGSYTGNGSANGPEINLGWEPQYVLLRNSSSVQDWMIFDTMRGFTAGGQKTLLKPNTSEAEATPANYGIDITATGFKLSTTGASFNGSGNNYIYLAIRRPNKPPTTGTEVYNAIARTGTGATTTVTGVGFAPDLFLTKRRDAGTGVFPFDKLRGTGYLSMSNTNAETPYTAAVTDYLNDGVAVGTDGDANGSGQRLIHHFFKRAPGVFDICCYTGTGSARTVPHGLGVAPELMIVKRRDSTGNWAVWYGGVDSWNLLNGTYETLTGADFWNNSSPGISAISLGSNGNVNQPSATYVSYLFATKAGIQKITSFVGNGSSQTIDCGFTSGARFVCIKATSTAGDWLIGDSTRGLVAGNDPRLSLNSTDAEVTSEDWLDPHSSGFIVNQVAGSNANVNGVTYFVWAIA